MEGKRGSGFAKTKDVTETNSAYMKGYNKGFIAGKNHTIFKVKELIEKHGELIMGNYADDILDGTLCQVCNCIMDDLKPKDSSNVLLPPPGYPRTCDECKRRGFICGSDMSALFKD